MKQVLLINPPMHFARGQPYALEVSSPHLGLLYLASYARAHSDQFQFHYMDIAPEQLTLRQVLEHVRDLAPFAIGISLTTPQLQGAYELARALRTLPGRRIPLFCGGAHVTSDPTFVDRNPGLFDHAILGDAETAFLASLEALARGEELPHKQQGTPIQDLDSIPFPDRTMVKRGAYNGSQTVLLTRGCPYDCYFCSSPVVDKKVRVRSAENLVAELKGTPLGRGGEFLFADDTFTVKRKRVHEFCALVKKEGMKLRWRANARVDLLDEDLIVAMREGGCEWVHLGIEAGNEQIRKNVVSKGRFTNADVRRVVDMCHKHGVKVGAYIILGHPGETKVEIKQTHDMIFDVGLDGVSVGVLVPFPGTDVWKRAEADGVINNEIMDRFMRKDFGEGYSGNFPLYLPEGLSREYLFKEMQDINRRFYLNLRTFLDRLQNDLHDPRRLRLDARQLYYVVTRGGSSVRPFAKYWHH